MLTKFIEADDALAPNEQVVEAAINDLSGNVSEIVSEFVSKAEATNGRALSQFVRVVSGGD
ncbi:hypothetical protein [Leptodesmis sichuanensis]|uniref:hypothetical protein n=1 Tax=Leptodesmis sichuanensis TaxID=2906798 RepID=UPI001F190BC2|nr:hypothetical protein [Leptodesmis sichuanensis]UIE35999.1 hypothetical protein KIK02_12950 [Leptodesmis sichuanensis A121]